MSNAGSGTSKNARALTPQQLAMLQGMAGTAPVQQAQASMAGQQGLLGQPGAAGQAAQAPGMQGAQTQPSAGTAQPSAAGITPQMLAQLQAQYPQLFGGGGQ